MALQLIKSPVQFVENPHSYHFENDPERQLFGYTSTIHRAAVPDAYKGAKQSDLDRKAEYGSMVHKELELYFTKGKKPHTKEAKSWIALQQELHLTQVAAEYVVSDEEYFASCIDGVFQDEEGNIILVDYKTTSVIHYDWVALQLSFYKRWFQRMNPIIDVDKLAVVHMKDGKATFEYVFEYDWRILDSLESSVTKDILADDRDQNGNLIITPNPIALAPNPFWYREVFQNDDEEELLQLLRQQQQIEARIKELKEQMMAKMDENYYHSLKTRNLTWSRVSDSRATTFDSKSFANDHKRLYKKYLKESTRKGSIKVSINK